MVNAGMDVARLNYSHGTVEEHAETVRRVRDAAGRAGRPVAILQDLPGPKLRIGPLREDVVELKPGDRRDVHVRRGGRRGGWGGRQAHDDLLAGARGRAEPGRRDLPGGRLGAAAGDRDARRVGGGRRGGRGRRRGGLAPGPQHPRARRRAAGGARGGPRAAAPRGVDRGGHGGAVVRAPPRGHRIRARAHAPAADRQDGEAAGGASAPRRSCARRTA